MKNNGFYMTVQSPDAFRGPNHKKDSRHARRPCAFAYIALNATGVVRCMNQSEGIQINGFGLGCKIDASDWTPERQIDG